MTKHAIVNLNTGEWVKRVVIENDGTKNRFGVDYTPKDSERLEITYSSYEPTALRVCELLTTLSDSIHELVEV